MRLCVFCCEADLKRSIATVLRKARQEKDMSQAQLGLIMTHTKKRFYGSNDRFTQQRISYWESTGNLNVDDFLLALKLLDQQVKVGDLAVVKFKYLTTLHRQIKRLERQLDEKDERIKYLRERLGLSD